MKCLKSWVLEAETASGATLRVEERHLLHISVLEDALFRVSLKKDAAWRLGRTWTIAPGGNAPWEGRRREDLSGFTCPPPVVSAAEGVLTIATETLRLRVLQPLQMVWEAKINGAWQTFATDRATGAFHLGLRDHAHAHFLSRTAGEPVYGLGEKTGPLNRAGKRYEMRNLDAMGYDAESTDPLYKHVPFTMTRTQGAGCWSIFYDNLAGCWFDLGNELDNYHAPYRAYRAEDGDLDFYMSWAPQLLDLVKRQEQLTGGTAFPPRWSLGYSGSTMSYTDAPDAQAQLEGFLARIEEHQIPCDSFQMSSGYTSIGAKRYVFNWNDDKMPDPESMAAKFADQGIHLIANIKPCLLQDHPRYDEVVEAGLFIRASAEADAACGPERSVFWDDEGSHLDFTNPDTVAWWKANVASALLARGIGSTWNDNNEYEIWDRHARCAGFGEEVDIALMRPVMPILMTRASMEAQLEQAPDKRPYLISRSGAPGLQRYAQTWSGDNRTDWKTLRWNQRTGLGMSLSGFYNIGHDVGGFSGPRPEPELFVRWVQNGVFHPRFTIHSWNDDATVNEPWMYPEVTDLIRNAIRLRYRLLPYLYTCLWQAAAQSEPMLRPLFLDFDHDPQAWQETDSFLLGRDLLVATVLDKGVDSRPVYLPEHAGGWWDFHTGIWHQGGQWLEVPVTLETIPLFVRGGSVIPLSEGADRAAPSADLRRSLALFPAAGDAVGTSLMYEDDGVSVDPVWCVTHLEMSSDSDEVTLLTQREGPGAPNVPLAEVVLPAGERRSLILSNPTEPDGRIHL
ncbi:glycoside hydrolase family 31 protein [Epibacterium sp. MM17-32]|uniref:glycoside hydrolase family 31 protein n=1 Tax=Epibacterium sp. MM17-32 TaxID=2917734 RepID=UPI001EF406E3|nr:glycoside hydrolase family 31 protein [Epibacterium sp. MM17-32]MCG7626749.1 glycoside hydrolase family 31 protein [Epibacterium sp. MM17-32]